MDRKPYLFILIEITLVFIAWFLVNYFSSYPYDIPQTKALAIPFVWACLFVYLKGKQHTYIAINSYIIFLLFLFADRLNFGAVPPNVHIAYLLLSIFCVFLFISIYQNLLPKKPRYASIFSFSITLILYVIALFYIIYSINFNAGISREVFYAILQTNVDEAMDYAKDNISPLWVGLVFLVSLFIGFLLLRQEAKETALIEKSLLIFLVAIFGVLSFSNRDNIRIYSFANSTITEYWQELALFKRTQERLKSNKIRFEAVKSEVGETYLIVIGESLNKKNMGIYGYFRNTTPLLAEYLNSDNFIVFDNAYSIHIQTMQTLSHALTEVSQRNRKGYYSSPSIVNVLNKAGIETHWITNQNLAGRWDNLVSLIAHQADHLNALNKTIGARVESQNFDDAVIDKVNEVLQTDTKKNRVIFVHLMGSHGDYCERYPVEYNIFSGKLNESEFGKLSINKKWQQKLNCYDNSVVYNDFVVSSLISLIEPKDGVNGLVYFSDHGEDAVRGLMHNQSNFTFDMTQIPLLMWLSDGYKTSFSDKYSALQKNKNSLFPNDRIYDTLVGLLNIYTDNYAVINDLSSSAYYMKEDDATTLHGDIEYTSEGNHYYHQKKNISHLLKIEQLNRIIPERVNSIGKLKDIWFDNFRAFEIDVHYSDDPSDQFAIGHNRSVSSDIPLEEFIASITPSRVKKILLDFKNLTEENAERAFETLNRLDKQFSLKNKLIIESETIGSFYGKYQEAGWHISYFLPTNEITPLIEGNKTNAMEDLAKSIFEQVAGQNLASISFDRRAYPFVKKYLEPLVSENIEYHLRDPSIKLFDSDFQSELSNKNYLNDDRVKTITLPFESRFHL
jgi:glucan phosphoethanolaminetransferase (alkaline phosphatase superfamily)